MVWLSPFTAFVLLLLPFATAATVPFPALALAFVVDDINEKKERYIEYSIFKSLYSLRIVFPKYDT